MNDIPERDAAGLREFGLVTAAILALLFGLFFPWLLEIRTPVWPWGVAGVLASWALIHPASLKPVYYTWMRIGLVMGAISSRIVLSIVFYLIFTPVGWVMRFKGHDPMNRNFDPGASTYRKQTEQRKIQHMERPF